MKFIKVAFRLPFISPQINGSLIAIVSLLCVECVKLTDYWPAAIGGPGCLFRLFDVIRD